MTPVSKARPTVLFATDLEGDVDEGLRVASRLAADRSAALLIVHVVALRTSDGEGMLHHSTDVEPVTRRVMRLRPPDPMVSYLNLTLTGKPDEELARVAAEYDVELIVLEARKRRALARVLGPSLIERLGERVECPIVTYRPQQRAPITAQVLGIARPIVSHGVAPFSSLEATLDARVEAAVDWLDTCRQSITRIAQHASVQSAIADLLREKPTAKEDLRLRLREHLWATQALGIDVWIGESAEGGPPSVRSSLGVASTPSAEREEWMKAVVRDGDAVSLPFSAVDGRASVVLAGARVTLFGGHYAILGLTVDARRGLLRILSQPGPTPSAETYAFDSAGFFRSYTRFPEHLRRMGIQASIHQTPDHVRVCDPGANKFKSRRSSREAWPLTRMAESATSGNDGDDERGYRDYRGIMVVGSWRWIESYGLGIAAEMDLSDVRAR